MSNVLKVSVSKCECGEISEVLVPGYKKEEVAIELNADKSTFVDGTMLLHITAENASRGKSENWIVVDTQLFDTKNIEAVFEDCILSIKLPYNPEYKSRIIPVM